jgi:hypothetical protein
MTPTQKRRAPRRRAKLRRQQARQTEARPVHAATVAREWHVRIRKPETGGAGRAVKPLATYRYANDNEL